MSDWGLKFIMKLKPCNWKYRDVHGYKGIPLTSDRVHFGFLAQEVHALAPKEEYAFTNTDRNDLFGVNYHEFIGPLVKAVQEQQEEINQLREELTKCKGECNGRDYCEEQGVQELSASQ